MLGAEERRLRRIEKYAARPPARRAYAPEGGAIACPPLAGRQHRPSALLRAVSLSNGR
jgi:hypothetical protein